MTQAELCEQIGAICQSFSNTEVGTCFCCPLLKVLRRRRQIPIDFELYNLIIFIFKLFKSVALKAAKQVRSFAHV